MCVVGDIVPVTKGFRGPENEIVAATRWFLELRGKIEKIVTCVFCVYCLISGETINSQKILTSTILQKMLVFSDYFCWHPFSHVFWHSHRVYVIFWVCWSLSHRDYFSCNLCRWLSPRHVFSIVGVIPNPPNPRWWSGQLRADGFVDSSLSCSIPLHSLGSPPQPLTEAFCCQYETMWPRGKFRNIYSSWMK